MSMQLISPCLQQLIASNSVPCDYLALVDLYIHCEGQLGKIKPLRIHHKQSKVVNKKNYISHMFNFLSPVSVDTSE
jgi:hypothetical protein